MRDDKGFYIADNRRETNRPVRTSFDEVLFRMQGKHANPISWHLRRIHLKGTAH